MKKNHKPFGEHILADFYQIESDRLFDYPELERVLRIGFDLSGLTLIDLF